MDPYGYDEFSQTLARMSPDKFECYLQAIRPHARGCAVGFFGDSHLRTVICPEREPYHARGITPHIAYIPGATLLGFGRRVSTVQHFTKVDAYLRHINPYAIVLKFGQVDVDLGYYYRIVIKNDIISQEKYFLNIIYMYGKVLTQLISTYKKVKFFVLNINYPTIVNRDQCTAYTSRIITENISDKTLAKYYEKELFHAVGDYESRFAASKLFNSCIENIIGKICTVINLDDFFLNCGKLKSKYLSDNDQHYTLFPQDRVACTNFIINFFDCDLHKAP